ncbi:TPA: DUF6404 family protein [Vibrio parahaemolyticus]|uniref:Magnesium transporter n=1 Tax=Vibrio parahaemolyticus TaxID=670 RepID=A0AA46L1B3_VIBPH|nr:DUF6404 family protein [Vibrio parahaemolyticus]EID4334149.1 magnesium transporter [Vibrio parahaemolyticus]TXN12281.1 magnesium transporter [Vibrio parahaemolyticus]
MDKAKFIQQHLIEKGVPADLTRPTAFIWSKYKDASKKPLVFQSPMKVLLIHGLLMGLVWGSLMWIMIWHTEPERWKTYVISSAMFGILIGLINVFRIVKARKNLGEKSWEKWCKQNYE